MLEALKTVIAAGDSDVFERHTGKDAISIQELADALGVHRNTISRWVKNQQLPEFTERGARVWRRMGDTNASPLIFILDGLREFFGPKPGSEAARSQKSAS